MLRIGSPIFSQLQRRRGGEALYASLKCSFEAVVMLCVPEKVVSPIVIECMQLRMRLPFAHL